MTSMTHMKLTAATASGDDVSITRATTPSSPGFRSEASSISQLPSELQRLHVVRGQPAVHVDSPPCQPCAGKALPDCGCFDPQPQEQAGGVRPHYHQR